MVNSTNLHKLKKMSIFQTFKPLFNVEKLENYIQSFWQRRKAQEAFKSCDWENVAYFEALN